MKIFVLAPTFNELCHVKKFLQAWQGIALIAPRDVTIEIVIANANMGDETSEYIYIFGSSSLKVTEVACEKEDFWSSSIAKGLKYIFENSCDDLIVLTNIDVRPIDSPLELIMSIARVNKPTVIATKVSDERNEQCSLELGSKFSCLALNLKKPVNEPYNTKVFLDEFPGYSFLEVDMMPTRFVISKVRTLQIAGFPNYTKLPHYAADYEYTYRLKKNRVRLLVTEDYNAVVDAANTGVSIYNKRNNFFSRLNQIFNKKSKINVTDSFWLVILCVPKRYVFSALLSTYFKIILFVLFGSKVNKFRG